MSLWDRDEDVDYDDPEPAAEPAPEASEGQSLEGKCREQLEAMLSKVSQIRSQWSGNKADPFFPSYIKALKIGKAIQAKLRTMQAPRYHDPSTHPTVGRATANSAWESLDAKILINRMVERGLSDAQIKHVMKTQFKPVKKKNY